MMLKPNYLLGFSKMFALVFIGIVIIMGGIPYLQGKEFNIADVLEMGVFWDYALDKLLTEC